MKASEVILLGVGILATFYIVQKTGLLSIPLATGIGTPTQRPAGGTQSVVPRDDFKTAVTGITAVLTGAFNAFGSDGEDNDGAGVAQTAPVTL